MKNYCQRGGVSLPHLSVTWPFANIVIDQNGITISIDIGSGLAKLLFPVYVLGIFVGHYHEVRIPYENIASVKKKKFVPFLADGVRITTKNMNPEYIYFWSVKSSDRILQELSLNLQVEEN